MMISALLWIWGATCLQSLAGDYLGYMRAVSTGRRILLMTVMAMDGFGLIGAVYFFIKQP